MLEYNYVILEDEKQHFELGDPEKWMAVVKILCEEQEIEVEDFMHWVYQKHKKAQDFHEEQQRNPNLIFDGPVDLLERAKRMEKFFREWLQISE